VFCALAVPAASAQPSQSTVVHHDLAVALDPGTHRLKVRDRIRIPGALVTAPLTIALNADLAVQASGGLKLRPLRFRVPDSAPASGPDRPDSVSRVLVNVYGVEGATPGQDVVGEFDYEGVINYATQQPGSEYARAFAESPGRMTHPCG
jgi:hypothetical protein